MLTFLFARPSEKLITPASYQILCSASTSSSFLNMSRHTDNNRSSSWNSGGQGGSNNSGYQYDAHTSGSQNNNLFSRAPSSYQSTPTFTYGYKNSQPNPMIPEPSSASGDISQSWTPMPPPALQISQQNTNIAYTSGGSFYYPDMKNIWKRSDLPPSTQPPGVLVQGPVDKQNRPIGRTFGSFIVYPGLPPNFRTSFINYIMTWLRVCRADPLPALRCKACKLENKFCDNIGLPGTRCVACCWKGEIYCNFDALVAKDKREIPSQPEVEKWYVDEVTAEAKGRLRRQKEGGILEI
ncbi:hypothetical protein QBC37DRAFT_458360 [Rhypophila decipiens]|uniref:Uncharacterized protein n=1 Tax=Rhypophila decipiens TaxID=261697 RepID=A0AAN7B189_9PEZI|nr:hypothetical protein QBC37DRAFT_458360 [Rhypophila decipiens]